VDVIWHDLKLNQLRLGFGDDVLKDFREPLVYASSQNRTPELGAPHDMVLAGIDDVTVALVLHSSIIQIEANESIERMEKTPVALSPTAEAGGFTAELGNRPELGGQPPCQTPPRYGDVARLQN
jgi:hypothetical protein